MPCGEVSSLQNQIETTVNKKNADSQCFITGACKVKVNVSQCINGSYSQTRKTVATVTIEIYPFKIHAGDNEENSTGKLAILRAI